MGLKRGVVKKEKNFDFRCLGVIFLIFWIILSCSETSQSPVSLKTVEGKARDFMLKDLNNQKFLLSEQQGKPVLSFSVPPGARPVVRKFPTIKKFTRFIQAGGW